MLSDVALQLLGVLPVAHFEEFADATTGKQIWVQPVGLHPLSLTTGTPALHADRVYVPISQYEISLGGNDDHECCKSHGAVTALDARTGAVKYEGGRPPKPAKFFSSPVAFDGKVLITSDGGDTFVIKAGPSFEVLGTNSVGEGVSASLALADRRIYIRGESHLFCVTTS